MPTDEPTTNDEHPQNSSSASIENWTNQVHTGDAIHVLDRIPSNTVHCAVTSPPYFNLRDYGVEEQIGNENTIDQYIENLLTVANHLHDVLHPSGSWWLNIGDAWAGSAGPARQATNTTPGHDTSDWNGLTDPPRRKSKYLLPHRIAIALENQGWIVRSDAVWVKPNGMPASVKDRLNEEKEFLFHLTPSEQYYFDLDSIREPHAQSSIERDSRGRSEQEKWEDGAPGQTAHSSLEGSDAQNMLHPEGKNPGDILEIPTTNSSNSHFATFPKDLCTKPIKSTCPREVCTKCHAPVDSNLPAAASQCNCSDTSTKPGICIDPFAGTGTALEVAKDNDRQFIGIELNEEYTAIAQQQLGITVDDPNQLLDDENQKTLTGF